MTFNINEMRSQLTLDGARPSQFYVQVQNPANASGDVKLPFMCEAASIPALTVGEIQVPYFGRKIKVAGDRTFANWNVTIINDEDFLIRNAMEEWSNKINSFEGNLRTFGGASPLLYKSEALVTQMGKVGTPVRTYKFKGLFPVEITQIELSWDSTDQIERFQVVFAYDSWVIDSGITGNAGGE